MSGIFTLEIVWFDFYEEGFIIVFYFSCDFFSSFFYYIDIVVVTVVVAVVGTDLSLGSISR